VDWYYAKEGQTVGPIAEEDIPGLVRSGEVHSDTLIWHDGLPSWTAYGQLTKDATRKPSRRRIRMATRPGGIVCSQCGRDFPPDRVVRHGDENVCAECNPALFPHLQSPVAAQPKVQRDGFWRRVVAKLARPPADARPTQAKPAS